MGDQFGVEFPLSGAARDAGSARPGARQAGRRAFLQRAAKISTGLIAGTLLAEVFASRRASALQLLENDPRIHGVRVTYPSPKGGGEMGGYLVRPARARPARRLPAVLVVHENRGLNPHIADVARRVACAGYMAFAPDALYPLGGYPGSDDEGRELQSRRPQSEMLEDFVAAVGYLQMREDCTGRVAAAGFSFGGAVAHQLSIRAPGPGLACAVPFYGAAPAPQDAARVRCPVMAHLADRDPRVNASQEACAAAMPAPLAGEMVVHRYPGTQHGFHNDTSARFDPEAARIAWCRTLEFLDANLREPD